MPGFRYGPSDCRADMNRDTWRNYWSAWLEDSYRHDQDATALRCFLAETMTLRINATVDSCVVDGVWDRGPQWNTTVSI